MTIGQLRPERKNAFSIPLSTCRRFAFLNFNVSGSPNRGMRDRLYVDVQGLHLVGETSPRDLEHLGREPSVPVVFLQGDHDHRTLIVSTKLVDTMAFGGAWRRTRRVGRRHARKATTTHTAAASMARVVVSRVAKKSSVKSNPCATWSPDNISPTAQGLVDPSGY